MAISVMRHELWSSVRYISLGKCSIIVIIIKDNFLFIFHLFYGSNYVKSLVRETRNTIAFFSPTFLFSNRFIFFKLKVNFGRIIQPLLLSLLVTFDYISFCKLFYCNFFNEDL